MLKKKPARIILLLILAGVTVALGIWLLFINFINYSQRFSELLKDERPKFEALNANTLSEIHHPDGVKIIQQSNLDLHAPANDNYLYSEYIITNGNNLDLLLFYKEELEASEWKLSLSEETYSGNRFYFNRDAACVKLEFFSDSDHFRISVKHDIRKIAFESKPNNPFEELFINLTLYSPCPP